MWVREIELMSGLDVLVYAHTVIPLSTLTANPFLRQLGTKSLGVTLSSVEGVSRTEFEVACLNDRHELWQRAMREGFDEYRDLWARRSAFSIHGRPVLVSEVFVLASERRPPSVRLAGGAR
jgi:chorismate--pyruvate lyase